MEHPGHGHQAGAVQGGVDQLEPRGFAQAGPDGPGLDGVVQGFLAVLTHVGNQTGGQTLFKGDELGTLQNVGLLDFGIDNGGGIVGHLAAVGPVSLVAVVLGGVVGGGDHDAGVGTIESGGEGQGGHRHQCVIDADLDAVGSQNAGGVFGKHIGVDAAVVGDGNQLVAPLGLHPVGKPLGGLTDHVDIHPVGARAQHAPQAGGAEFQRDGEAVLDLFVAACDFPELLCQSRVLQLSGGPALVIVHVHVDSPILLQIFN